MVGGEDVCFGRKLGSRGQGPGGEWGHVHTTELIGTFGLINIFIAHHGAYSHQEKGGRICVPKVLTFGVNQDKPKISPQVAV